MSLILRWLEIIYEEERFTIPNKHPRYYPSIASKLDALKNTLEGMATMCRVMGEIARKERTSTCTEGKTEGVTIGENRMIRRLRLVGMTEGQIQEILSKQVEDEKAKS